jgi:hypothetical protein
MSNDSHQFPFYCNAIRAIHRFSSAAKYLFIGNAQPGRRIVIEWKGNSRARRYCCGVESGDGTSERDNRDAGDHEGDEARSMDHLAQNHRQLCVRSTLGSCSAMYEWAARSIH